MGVKVFMKKFLALFLAISTSAMIFASCGEVAETTTEATTTVATTTDSGETTTEATTTEATTTVDNTTRTSLVEGVLDTYEHDYIVKLVENPDTNEIIGVAVCYWETKKVTSDLVFDEIFTYRDVTGKQFSYPVIQIGYGQGIVALQASVVETISIPSTVKLIYANSFSGYPNLKNLSLAEGIEEIGSMAFWHCSSLEQVTIPSSVTTIGRYAFADCQNLKSVTLPRRFESEVESIFYNCPNVQFIYVD